MKFKRYALLLLIQICLPTLWAQDIQTQTDTVTTQEIQTQTDLLVSDRPASELLKQANDLYVSEKYQDAIDLYEKILSEKGESAIIYYNLGNAYYRRNEIAQAILNYERALLRDPGNEDVRFNISWVKQKTIDKIEPVEPFFLTQWITDVRNIFNTNQWSWIGIVVFLFFLGCLVLFFFSRKIILKKIGFYTGIVLLIGSISCNIFAYQQKKKLTAKDTAIILVQTVTVKSSPDKSGTDIVVLHEGSKVSIKSKLGNWNEIVLENGTVGWIESNKIEII